MTSNKNTGISLQDDLSLISLLGELGHEPISQTGEETQYAAVFTDRASNRSVLIVNNRLNSWFDRSLGKGGNVIDFARIYWPELSTTETEQKLRDFLKRIETVSAPEQRTKRRRKPVKVPHYQIDKTAPIGRTTEVTDFLKESNLWEIADLNMQEVHYFVVDQKGKRKDFCAAGWQNENGGWEIRASHFQSCIGARGMTVFVRSETVLAIFPEYTDYLKQRNDKYLSYASVIILNYPDFLPASIKRAQRFEKILLYVDESREGYGSAIAEFTQELPQTTVFSV
ncbi:hypothetical protein [Sphingobacterium kitahiroshimense]|uniref:Toprim domain-containing protein n=1 Tax=Sphingobacterium kitahiroshimense TaxID=470446 RepID=A0ABV0BM55_9SPHI